MELRYFQDKEGREVDFVVLEDRKPVMFVECKWSDDAINPALRYLKKRFPTVDTRQVSATGKKDFQSPEGIRVTPALTFLKELV